MGYAIFTARKLMLQNRLNQANYRLMVLAQQQQDLTQQAANLEMQNGIKSALNSVFASNIAQDAYNQLATAAQGKEVTILGTKYKIDSESSVSSISSAVNAKLDGIRTLNAAGEAASKANLQGVQAIGNQIDLEMKKLDTQVKEITAEMEQVEKAEETAIKASAPKYGGGAA